MRFEWDEAKNRSNLQKHGVSFEDIRELFYDSTERLELLDVDHSEIEERFITIGPLKRGVVGLVVVIWTQRDDDVTRIISARWATKREQARYQSYMDQRS